MTQPNVNTARVITVTSGKGGVGKTNVSVNLAAALAREGKRALLVDCDPGLADANILMGRRTAITLADILSNQCAVEDALLDGPGGMKFLPGHSGCGTGSSLDRSERERLSRALRPHAEDFDTVIVDTASGIGADLLDLVATSDAVLLVVTPEPTSFMDAYALTKALAVRQGYSRIMVVTNMVASEAAGRDLFNHFRDVVEHFLPVAPVHIGSIPKDAHVPKAVLRKKICLEAFPSAQASRAFAGIARTISQKLPQPTVGGQKFFAMEACHGAQ